MFCCSGERPRKGGVRFAKGLNTIIYKPISKRKPDHNLMSRFCLGAKGSRKRGARAFSGTIILDNPHVFLQAFGNLTCIISKSYLNHI